MGRSRKMSDAKRRRQIWRMRLCGKTQCEIACKLGVSHTTVWREEHKAAESLGSVLSNEGRLDGLWLLKRMGRGLERLEQQVDVVLRVQRENPAPKAQLATATTINTLVAGMRSYHDMLAKACGLLTQESNVTVTINVAIQTAVQAALSAGMSETTIVKVLESEIEWPKKPLEIRLLECKALLESLESERCSLPAST